MSTTKLFKIAACAVLGIRAAAGFAAVAIVTRGKPQIEVKEGRTLAYDENHRTADSLPSENVSRLKEDLSEILNHSDARFILIGDSNHLDDRIPHFLAESAGVFHQAGIKKLFLECSQKTLNIMSPHLVEKSQAAKIDILPSENRLEELLSLMLVANLILAALESSLLSAAGLKRTAVCWTDFWDKLFNNQRLDDRLVAQSVQNHTAKDERVVVVRGLAHLSERKHSLRRKLPDGLVLYIYDSTKDKGIPYSSLKLQKHSLAAPDFLIDLERGKVYPWSERPLPNPSIPSTSYSAKPTEAIKASI